MLSDSNLMSLDYELALPYSLAYLNSFWGGGGHKIKKDPYWVLRKWENPGVHRDVIYIIKLKNNFFP